jgi:hypothetical protein
MMKATAAQWVKSIETLDLENTGDPTLVLRRVYQQFAVKAVELYQKASGDNAQRIREAAAFYEQAALDVQRLIDQGTSFGTKLDGTPVTREELMAPEDAYNRGVALAQNTLTAGVAEAKTELTTEAEYNEHWAAQAKETASV